MHLVFRLWRRSGSMNPAKREKLRMIDRCPNNNILLFSEFFFTIIYFNASFILKYRLVFCVYSCVLCVLLSYILQQPDCWLKVGIRQVLPPATSAQVLLGFPVSVYKQMLRWFPRLQVATACFSSALPALNSKLPFHNCLHVQNYCHRATAQLQLINYYYYYY